MKKLITLIPLTLFVISTFAGKKDPSLTIRSAGNYIIIVDGKRFNYHKEIFIENLKKGEHYIDVFEMRKRFLGKRYKLVSSKQFIVDKKDIDITVNSTGYIQVGKQEKGWDGDYWLRDVEKRNKGKQKSGNK